MVGDGINDVTLCSPCNPLLTRTHLVGTYRPTARTLTEFAYLSILMLYFVLASSSLGSCFLFLMMKEGVAWIV